MLTLLLAAATVSSAASAAASSPSPIEDNIDWPAYLARHDPIWRSGNTSCYHGYTQLNATIKHEGASGCAAAAPCTSAAACPDEAASACDACPGCSSFGLSPQWHNGTLPQLYGNVTPYMPNPGWTTWTKGGPALPRHAGCEAPRMSGAWEDGAWLGNGLQGAILRWVPGSSRGLRLDVNRADIWDRRSPGSTHATGNAMFDRPRLPTGYLTINTTADILHGEWRVSLGGGVLRGFLLTAAGRVDFLLASLVPPREVLVLQWNATSGSEALALAFVPTPGDSTRQNPPPSYALNPPPNCTASQGGALVVCHQALLACDCGYATALRVAPYGSGSNGSGGSGSGGAGLAVLHIANDWPASTSAATAAAVAGAAWEALGAPGGLAAALQDQAAWWGTFFRTSFVSIPDTSLEATYVLQTAKVGAATRARGGVAMDLHGPWWQRSGWELYWFDMNVAVTYWPLYAAARFDLAATLTDFLLSNTSQLAANPLGVPDAMGMGGVSSYDLVSTYSVTPGQMLGNFPWICHNLYSHAAFSGNETMMREVVFPLLRGAINVYRSFAFVGEDGLLHLPATSSPEYPYPHGPTNDT
jgi:alpha-L-fucosidase 2